MTRARRALALLGITHADLLTIQRAFLRQLAHETKELLESFK